MVIGMYHTTTVLPGHNLAKQLEQTDKMVKMVLTAKMDKTVKMVRTALLHN